MEARSHPSFGIIFVTVPSQEQAEQLAHLLIEAKLAACVSFMPIRSVYTWNGAIQAEDEWQVLIKSSLDKFSALEAKIRSVHPYDVPEIIALPILQGSEAYLQWIANAVQDERTDLPPLVQKIDEATS